MGGAEWPDKDDASWQRLAPHLLPEDLAWLRSRLDHSGGAEEDSDADLPLHELFAEEDGAAEQSQTVEGILGALEPPRRPEDIPSHLRNLWSVAEHRVGGLGLATVRGGRSGHGDVLWGAAQYTAELLETGVGAAAAERLLAGRGLAGLRVLELGAGLGLPCWVALRQGAKVVASDVGDPERICALAAGAALNTPEALGAPTSRGGEAHVRSHSWGEPCEGLLSVFGAFDLLLVCDCLYITELHEALLSSIKACLAPGGVALCTFALHHEHNVTAVFNFFSLAEARGFAVEDLEEKQMPVRCGNMPDSRFYVYARTLRVKD